MSKCASRMWKQGTYAKFVVVYLCVRLSGRPKGTLVKLYHRLMAKRGTLLNRILRCTRRVNSQRCRRLKEAAESTTETQLCSTH